MFGGSPSLSTTLFAHFQRWGRFCLCGGYCPDNILGELGLVAPIVASRFLQNIHPIFIGGCRGQQFKSTLLLSSP